MRSRESVDQPADGGFTLIELLVVTVIIGILAAIAIPLLMRQTSKADDGAIQSDLRNAATAEQAYLTDHFTYTDDQAQLVSEGFKSSSDSAYSGGVAVLTIHYLTADGAVAPTATGDGFDVTATSSSGKTWCFNSELRGLQVAPGSANCP